MDTPEERLRRLAALNRGPLREAPRPSADIDEIRRRLQVERGKTPAGPGASPNPSIVFPRNTPAAQSPAPTRYREPTGPIVPLEEAAPGRPILHAEWGPAYLVRRSARDLDVDGRRIALHLRHALADVTTDHWCPEPRMAAESGPVTVDDVAFLDLETTGLSNSPLFLVGLMTWEDDGLVVDQYFARDLNEEAAAIALFRDAVAGKRLLVTFNGRSFDVPYVRSRAAYTGVPCPLELVHLDLIRDCRRRWRAELGNCRLQTLERHVCGRDREDDLPGSEVPDAYYAFLRTGNAADVGRILLHNALDLLTLADLTARVLRAP
jgi:uncharacterized protein YprB with RNaseH-like and TPR domain